MIRSTYAVALVAACSVAACATPGYGVYHRVQPGDTLYGLAVTYDVPPHEILRANRVRTPERLEAGASLFIPGAAELKVVPRRVIPPAAPRRAAVARRTDPTEPRRLTPARPSPSAGTAGATPRAAGFTDTNARADDGEGRCGGDTRCRFAWPVDGVVTSAFGFRAGGAHKGIDVQAPTGTPVYAADDGEVVYSKSGQTGYGNLVLIRHDETWTTVYAHLSVRLVESGRRVRRGELIGRVGRTGRATAPHLHFEVRRARTAVDPIVYLPRRDSERDRVADRRNARTGG